MMELKYYGDTAQYLTELLDLNEVVQWFGVTFRKHISRTLPKEITRLVYSRNGGVPDTDEDFLTAVQEVGRIYETMLQDPGLSLKAGKNEPVSKKEHSNAGRPRDNSSNKAARSNPSLKQPAAKKAANGDRKDNIWATTKLALEGIDQQKIDARKKAKTLCWRCGRDQHHTLACYAKKDVEGTDLPAAPTKNAAVGQKRPKEEEEEKARPPKKARFAATVARPPSPAPDRYFEELPDSDSNC